MQVGKEFTTQTSLINMEGHLQAQYNKGVLQLLRRWNAYTNHDNNIMKFHDEYMEPINRENIFGRTLSTQQHGNMENYLHYCTT